MSTAKHVVVLLRRPPLHPRTAQGLRTAVGYLLANLRVTIVLAGPAEALLPLCASADRPPALSMLCRHLSTLRALGQDILLASATDLCALAERADVLVTW